MSANHECCRAWIIVSDITLVHAAQSRPFFVVNVANCGKAPALIRWVRMDVRRVPHRWPTPVEGITPAPALNVNLGETANHHNEAFMNPFFAPGAVASIKYDREREDEIIEDAELHDNGQFTYFHGEIRYRDGSSGDHYTRFCTFLDRGPGWPGAGTLIARWLDRHNEAT